MQILSTSKGFILISKSLDELRGVIDHLSGMLEWIESEKILPPYLYSIFDDRIDKQEIETLLDEMKKKL